MIGNGAPIRTPHAASCQLRRTTKKKNLKVLDSHWRRVKLRAVVNDAKQVKISARVETQRFKKSNVCHRPHGFVRFRRW
jgi:hypothetical protein